MALPNSVRYIKNGGGGSWWKTALEKKQLHAGWNPVSEELLHARDWPRIRALCANTQDFNAFKTLVDQPSQHVWITFESGFLWWCLVDDEVTVYGPSTEDRGHFSIGCALENSWSNESLTGKKLIITDLPGTATTTQGFKGTVCEPGATEQILRIIRGESNPLVITAQQKRAACQQSVQAMLKQLSPQDFELLISLILDRTGWTRLSRIGGATEGIDMDVENWGSGERAFVQVKGAASQNELDDYIERFQNRAHYARMVFAVHSPRGQLRHSETNVQFWDDDRVAALAVRLGLGGRIETKLG
jgi:hypothetical protein